MKHAGEIVEAAQMLAHDTGQDLLWSPDWVLHTSLPHCPRERRNRGGVFFTFPENDLIYPFSFDLCNGKHMGLHRWEGLKPQRGLVKQSQVPRLVLINRISANNPSKTKFPALSPLLPAWKGGAVFNYCSSWRRNISTAKGNFCLLYCSLSSRVSW